MGTAGSHIIRIRRESQRAGPPMWRATCSCGWRSHRAVAAPFIAQADGAAHVAEGDRTG
jgi:hypothetical protein